MLAPTARPQLIQAGVQVPAPKDLAQLCLDAWTLKLDIDTQQKDLDEKKGRIIAALDGEGTVVQAGAYRITVAPRTSVTIADLDKLRQVVGTNFDALVTQKLSFSPSKNLLAIFDDPGHPDYQSVKPCMATSTTTQLLMKADAPEKGAKAA